MEEDWYYPLLRDGPSPQFLYTRVPWRRDREPNPLHTDRWSLTEESDQNPNVVLLGSGYVVVTKRFEVQLWVPRMFSRDVPPKTGTRSQTPRIVGDVR